MCGVCGILATNEAFAISERLVTDMSDTLVHRGPDDAGSIHLRSDHVALGHRRLSIVDLSSGGRQPMSNEDGSVWITFNGEIYNHAALRSELVTRGHRYRSATDTETIVHLYEEEGPRCVERLHGMFALAIWDRRSRQLLLARDRLGVKPLYYAQPAGGFVFASEIKALLAHPAVRPELDRTAFEHYLTFVSTPAPLTMFRGVYKLAPAERMTVSADGSSRRELYWSPWSASIASEVAESTEAELERRLVDLMTASIDRRMMSDVPFGVFLSGGVDSSTNVALMARLLERPVRTYSVAFAEDHRTNELAHARRVAEHWGTDHHELMIDRADAEAFLPELASVLDEPIADWVCVPLHFVSRLARADGTAVVQIGEGADELFHGYDVYQSSVRLYERWFRPMQRLPRPLSSALGAVSAAAAFRLGRGFNLASFLTNSAAGRFPFWGGAICYPEAFKERLLVGDSDRADSYGVVAALCAQAEHEIGDPDLLQCITYLELKQRLAELLLMRVDRITMANSVEGREPFLDHELVEFVLALPRGLKVRDGVGKYLLKKAVAPMLPEGIAYRTKQGFTAPVSAWFRGELGTRIQDQIRRSSLAELGLLDYDRIDDLWAAHRSGRGDWSYQLWNLYNLSAWHDRWVAGRVEAGSR